VPTEETYAHPVAHLPSRDALAERVDTADCLVAGDPADVLAVVGVDDDRVAVADAASLHPETYLTMSWRNKSALGEAKTAVWGDLDCAISGHE
jgi:hypothetical protein